MDTQKQDIVREGATSPQSEAQVVISQEPTRVVDAHEMQSLIDGAIERKWNRQFDESASRQLDSTRQSFLIPYIVHEYRDQKPTEPHYRCKAIVFLKDEVLPVEGWLDVDMEAFKTLEALPQYQGAKQGKRVTSGR